METLITCSPDFFKGKSEKAIRAYFQHALDFLLQKHRRLVNHLLPLITGEYRIVNAYDAPISPCLDCRFCWAHAGCAIQDEMQEIYEYIQDCDRIARLLYGAEN